MSRTSSDDDTNEEHGDMKDEDAVVDYMALLSVVNLAKVVFRLFYFRQELRTNAQLLLLKDEKNMMMSLWHYPVTMCRQQ